METWLLTDVLLKPTVTPLESWLRVFNINLQPLAPRLSGASVSHFKTKLSGCSESDR